ncbi:MAG: HAMP domain-containing sensor histidine kinase [Candidatus Margulisiibacteriota bacterium]|jgi:signal transduction histidine kinase
MNNQTEKLQAYVRVKWGLISLAAPIFLSLFFFRIISSPELAAWGLLFLVGAGTNLYLQRFIAAKTTPAKQIMLSLLIDIAVSGYVVYFLGGIESRWVFLPMITIFFAGGMLNLPLALGYATLAFILVAAFFLLEYSMIVPDLFNPHVMKGMFHDSRFYFDNFGSLAALYYFSAGAGAFLNIQIEKSILDSRASQVQSENARKALMNIAGDLENAKKDLEKRVRERTAELEEAKTGLESKIKERTGELENSRKAILHMMKDLKEDIKKMREVDSMKTEFLSMISHELRTPLTLIKGYVALLQAGKIGPLSPEQNKTIEIVARQSDHLHSMIDSILDISRLEIGKPIPLNRAPMSFKSAVEKTIEALKIQAKEKNIEIISNISDFLPTIVGDEIKIKRVLTNLLGNAMKFTPEDGKIFVNAFISDSEVKVEVVDNGIGISRENLAKIFEKFFQVDSSITRNAGGMGMGLAISKELIELHGGKITADSEGLGKGTKVTFTLPINTL